VKLLANAWVANETLLFLSKLTSLSHLRERNQKNCLNCNAEVHGKYCHVCGQENLETTESLWHLITHFFNDITHFDGKFFSTLRLLLSRPGFLSSEYKIGRRQHYLNPVRMYVFSSFVFFFVFFSVVEPDENLFEGSVNNESIEDIASLNTEEYKNFVELINNSNSRRLEQFSAAIYPAAGNNRQVLLRYTDSVRNATINTMPKLQLTRIANLPADEYHTLMEIAFEMDSSEFSHFSKSMYDNQVISKNQFKRLLDSIRIAGRTKILMGDTVYKDRASYDSLIKVGAVKDNWLERKLRYREFEINDKYGNEKSDLWKHIIELALHYFPQLLFVSLPLFAFVLYVLYQRNRSYTIVNHGIYSVHLYITYFIALLLLLFSYKLQAAFDVAGLNWFNRFIIFYLLWYEYKAMRHFYGQRRAKTIFKFLLALIARLIILLLLAIFFFGISFLNA
jgi:hypothetical protein